MAINLSALRYGPAQAAAVSRAQRDDTAGGLTAWTFAPTAAHLADGKADGRRHRAHLDNGGGTWRGDVAASSGAWAAFVADGKGEWPWI